jgi:uncharacterized phage protein (TIGR01671 family)
MNRDIKFKAWIVDNGQSTPEGQIYYDIKDFHGTGKLLDYFEDIQITGEDFLMQYTGLKDKNGVEIYEGDIVRNTRCGGGRSHIGEITISPRSGVMVGLWPIWFDSEVIGNIHENPELLEPPCNQ